MRRILIIGNAGVGKTTFALKLAEKTGLPLVHLDKIYWRGNWEHLSRGEFDEALQAELQKEAWIIDGNFSRTLPIRLSHCDGVFYFDFPTVSALWGITKRTLQHYGKCRSDMGGNCPAYFDKSLYKATATFNKKHRKEYYELLKNQKNVVIFKNRKQAETYLKELIG